jgi:hypothetical protein
VGGRGPHGGCSVIYSVTYLSADEFVFCDLSGCIKAAEVLVTPLISEDGCLCTQHWIVLRVHLIQSGNDIVGDVTLRHHILKTPGDGGSEGVRPSPGHRVGVVRGNHRVSPFAKGLEPSPVPVRVPTLALWLSSLGWLVVKEPRWTERPKHCAFRRSQSGAGRGGHLPDF